ncbi:MAG TPA: zinc ribbon domain-containing protein [Candidatus Dormibacteraeota bacterium]|nr:zinc ribbon domain-containing protein [Candidatus Dormibacteraeota bacterium]
MLGRQNLASGALNCPSCGFALQPNAGFCTNCGTRTVSQPTHPTNQAPSVYYPAPATQPPVSTGPYKVVIAVLLVVILLLGIGYFVGSAHFPLANYRYSLANPPNLQSTQPGPAFTTQSPAFTIWSACGSSQSAGCSMSGNGWREGSVPDTFDYYVSFASNVSITVYFFTMGQFVQYSVCNGDLSCVSGSYDSIPPTANLPQYTIFKLGEGCADYLAIYVASGSGIMHPNVGVSRPAVNPPGATGYCAQAGA